MLHVACGMLLLPSVEFVNNWNGNADDAQGQQIYPENNRVSTFRRGTQRARNAGSRDRTFVP